MPKWGWLDRLIGGGKTAHIDDQCWFVLQDHLHNLYTSKLLYASETDYNDPNVSPSSINHWYLHWASGGPREICSKSSYNIDTETEPELEVAAELEIVNESEPEPEIEEPLVETSADLPAELAMELVSSSLAVRVSVSLRSPDLYDLLQIFLQETVKGDKVIHSAKYSWFSSHPRGCASICYVRIARAVILSSRCVTKASFTPTTLV